MIENLENVNSMVFHMGTAEKEGSLVTDGGRVLVRVRCSRYTGGSI